MFSIEFFPPKTQVGFDKIETTINLLNSINPQYYSVTYGAGGSTQQGTHKTVEILRKKNLDVAPHLSCVGSSKQELTELILQYKEQGIKRLVALRGDLPSGMGRFGECRYASDLVELIREISGDWFHIEVAAYPEMHPQAHSPQQDLQNFIHKVKAGANSAITQYFYNSDSYFRFVDELAKQGVNIPIIAGIMPINNYSQLARFSDACGAEIPRWLRLRLQHYYDDVDSMREFATDVVADLCQKLIDNNVAGIHFYTLNQPEPTLKVFEKLNITPKHKYNNNGTSAFV
jgi:methylenetetrahydrofolate reductase (NADPH)